MDDWLDIPDIQWSEWLAKCSQLHSVIYWKHFFANRWRCLGNILNRTGTIKSWYNSTVFEAIRSLALVAWLEFCCTNSVSQKLRIISSLFDMLKKEKILNLFQGTNAQYSKGGKKIFLTKSKFLMQNHSCGLGELKTLKKFTVRHFYAREMEFKVKDFVNLRPLLLRSMK